MMSSNKGKRPLRHLTAGDKIEAIQRIHDGESKASVARDIGVPESTLRGWCKNEEKLRYMSRQSGGSDCKMSIEKLTEKMADDAAMAATAASSLFGPPEKRVKLDTSMPSISYSLGANGKIKYEDMGGSNAFKGRSSMNALDFSSADKGLSAMNFNGLAADYTAAYNKASAEMMNGHAKIAKDNLMKGFGGPSDMSKSIGGDHKNDMTLSGMSPLTSLSHLSGMTGLAQAMSYNELATNLSMLYNNPSALSQLTGMANFANTLNTSSSSNNNNHTNQHSSSSRNSRQKSQPSPRSDIEKSQSLTVKNLAKLQQKSSSTTSMDAGLDMSDKMKKPAATSVSRDPPVDEAVLYWLRSQQAMMGLNNLYSSMPNTSSPQRASPHQIQQQIQQLLQPSNAPSPVNQQQTPSTTPSGHSDDTKNSNWFWNWYKSIGGQADKQNVINNNNTISSSMMSAKPSPSSYDNILYAQLTKDTRNSPSPRRLNPNASSHGVHTTSDADMLVSSNLDEQNNNKPEDLSAATSISRPVATSSPEPTSPDGSSDHLCASSIKVEFPAASPISTPQPPPPPPSSTTATSAIPPIAIKSEKYKRKSSSPSDVHSVLDNLLYSHHLNNNNTTNSNNNIGSPRNSDSDTLDSDTSSSPGEAVEHGEKFLKWLESCSDPNITAMQVMQFRTLLNSIRSKADRENNPAATAAVLASEERSRKRSRK